MLKLISITSFFCLLPQFSFAGDLGQILRDSSGVPIGFNLFEAHKACPPGTRMPTLREFANHGQSKGAKGILEVSQVDPRSVPADYNIFELYNVTDGSKDSFYYSSEGYLRHPDDEYGYMYFWSSSSMGSYGTIYMGNIGSVGMDGALYEKKLVTCLANH